MLTVVIADDHRIFREGLATLLRSVDDITITGEAVNGREAAATILKTKPDIAILDVSMPGQDGIEVTQELRQKGLDTKVILLTMHDDPMTADRAMKAGAYGYLVKDNAFDDLLTAIRAVSAGRRFISPSLAGEVVNLHNVRKGESSVLTDREADVLRLISGGLTNVQIAERLFISRKTVETHRMRMMQKLDLHSIADLVRYAVREGLIID